MPADQNRDPGAPGERADARRSKPRSRPAGRAGTQSASRPEGVPKGTVPGKAVARAHEYRLTGRLFSLRLRPRQARASRRYLP